MIYILLVVAMAIAGGIIGLVCSGSSHIKTTRSEQELDDVDELVIWEENNESN